MRYPDRIPVQTCLLIGLLSGLAIGTANAFLYAINGWYHIPGVQTVLGFVNVPSVWIGELLEKSGVIPRDRGDSSADLFVFLCMQWTLVCVCVLWGYACVRKEKDGETESRPSLRDKRLASTVWLLIVCIILLFGWGLYLASFDQRLTFRTRIIPEDHQALARVLGPEFMKRAKLEQIEAGSPYRRTVWHLGGVFRARPEALDTLTSFSGWTLKEGNFAESDLHFGQTWLFRVCGRWPPDAFDKYYEHTATVSYVFRYGAEEERVWPVRSVVVCDTDTSPELKLYVLTTPDWYRPDLRVEHVP